jgi:AmiR/NasT family two-component response regulator
VIEIDVPEVREKVLFVACNEVDVASQMASNVDQAKSLLMKQRNLDADGAYTLLCSMADKRNMRLEDFSRQLIEAANKLIV